MKHAAPIRILGIGSSLGDDEVGWLVATKLLQNLDPDKIVVSMHDRPGANLVRLMQGAEIVVLIDGVKRGFSPGTLCRLEGKEIHLAYKNLTSTHGFGVAEALQLAEKLGDVPSRIVLWGMEIESVDPDSGLSDAVRDAIPALVKAIQEEVNAL